MRRGEPELRLGVLAVIASWLMPAAAVGFFLVVPGCVPPPYRPPTADEPHATLKVRRVYEMTAGTRLDETCLVNGHRAVDASVESGVAASPRSDAFLVHPVPAKVEVASAFVHQEMRTVTEPYTVQVPYSTTQFSTCGFGTSAHTCSQQVTQYRSETRYRTVTKLVDVTDDSCKQSFLFVPVTNRVYLVDFTYRDHEVCSASCVEQVPSGADGTFRNVPCPLPTAAQAESIEGD